MQKLAIIGTGIAGMGAAHHLQHRYDISLFEKNDYTGGHTNTVAVNENGAPVFMDTGFMVFNYATYPNLCRLFEEIKAPVKKTSMSFSVQHTPSGLEYCGSGLNGLFAQRKNLFRPAYIRMLLQINRFNAISVKALEDPALENLSLGAYMHRFGFGEDMLWKYLVPMASAVWSTPMDKVLDFPAMTLIRFFKNHGFLGLNTQHQWYTLENGSQSYRELLIKPFKHTIKTSCAVTKVITRNAGAELVLADGNRLLFDKVVMACHADEALALLHQPSDLQQQLLEPFNYQENIATVHSDARVMPRTRSVWSSWNYRIEEHDGQLLPSTIYWMNSLQGVSPNKNYFVSINAVPGSIDPEKIHRVIHYTHPLFDLPAIEAQAELHRLNQNGPVYFCGSYFKYGFHEDAYTSALELSKQLV